MAKIELIGTSHIAKESTLMIRDRILTVKPRLIAVEIDAQRLPYLFKQKRTIQPKNILKVGLLGFLFGAIGGFAQRKLGEKVGLMPGADIRTAIRAAKAIGATVVLIDRPIEVTLRRLSKNVSFWEKLRFVGYLLFGVFISNRKELVKIDLKKVPSEKIIRLITSEIKNKFPSFYKVLVSERDEFMANQLKKLAMEFPKEHIIAVVGAGHINGLKNVLSKA